MARLAAYVVAARVAQLACYPVAHLVQLSASLLYSRYSISDNQM